MQDKIVGFVISAILLVGGFGILAIQIMIVLQKQRDIAILRSVGLRKVDILRIFLLQGMIVAVVGGLLGDVLGKIALTQLAKLKVHTEGLVSSDTFLIFEDPKFYVYGVLFALVVGAIASFIPAWRGSKVEPVDVLRGQIG
jgi:lipoprotein-releasing system permease protein